jgi:hypothetical protein
MVVLQTEEHKEISYYLAGKLKAELVSQTWSSKQTYLKQQTIGRDGFRNGFAPAINTVMHLSSRANTGWFYEANALSDQE